MAWRLEKAQSIRMFHHFAHVHNSDTVAHMLNDAKVMADKQICEAKVFLQFTQEVENLRLHRHIQRRDRLITNNQFGLSR